MFPVALSDSFRAAKRLWDSSNVIETVAGHAGEQRLHIMCALGLNAPANFGKPVTAKGHVPSPFIIKVATVRTADRSPGEFPAHALLGLSRWSSLGEKGWVSGTLAIQFWLSCICEVQYRTQQIVTSWSIQCCSGPAEWSAQSSDHTSRPAEEG